MQRKNFVNIKFKRKYIVYIYLYILLSLIYMKYYFKSVSNCIVDLYF